MKCGFEVDHGVDSVKVTDTHEARAIEMGVG